jgi:hypothetical protein
VPAASPVTQWVQLPSGRWISEKDPGYPFLAALFQAFDTIRLAPLFYGALGCLGLFFGARRWLGRFGGGTAVGLFCTSGAALLFAWRDYMPTFTDASLIAAGTGALLWAVLAAEATVRRRTWAGLAGFVALKAATFTRYTDIVVLGCAAVAVVVAWRLRKVPTAALAWWLGSVAAFGAGLAVFDDLVYGGPLKSGYQPGEIQFSLSAIGPNLRYVPAHLLQAMPMLVIALAAVLRIIARWARLRRAGDGPAAGARRDLAVGLAPAASWFSVWGLYSACTWTANDFVTTLQSARFYAPAIGAIALLGAWLLVRVPRRSSLAAATLADAGWPGHARVGSGTRSRRTPVDLARDRDLIRKRRRDVHVYPEVPQLADRPRRLLAADCPHLGVYRDAADQACPVQPHVGGELTQRAVWPGRHAHARRHFRVRPGQVNRDAVAGHGHSPHDLWSGLNGIVAGTEECVQRPQRVVEATRVLAVTEEEGGPAPGHADEGVRAVVDHLAWFAELLAGRVAVAPEIGDLGGQAFGERYLPHTGTAGGKVGHPLTPPVTRIGHR